MDFVCLIKSILIHFDAFFLYIFFICCWKIIGGAENNLALILGEQNNLALILGEQNNLALI